MAPAYKPPLWREERKKKKPTPCARRRLSPRPPRGPLPALPPPPPRLPPRCAPARHFRTTPLRGGEDGGEITARRDPRRGAAAAPDGTPHAGREMPPPALKGAHKAALPRARLAPRGPGTRLGAGAAGAREDLTLGGRQGGHSQEAAGAQDSLRWPLEQPPRGRPWLLRFWTRGRCSPGEQGQVA